MSKTKIKSTHARRVWDSRGRPTVEVEITLRYGAQGRAIAPAGASVGTGEAVELRDGGDAFVAQPEPATQFANVVEGALECVAHVVRVYTGVLFSAPRECGLIGRSAQLLRRFAGPSRGGCAIATCRFAPAVNRL